MIDLINGNPFSHYGLKLISCNGLLDMPARLGVTFYDWGDNIQPLVDFEDIYFKSKQINIVTLHDSRFHKSINPKSKLKELPKSFTLNTKYGSHSVSLLRVVETTRALEASTYMLTLIENKPTYSPPSAPSNLSGDNLDGYALDSQLGCIVMRVSKQNDSGSSIKSTATTWRREKFNTEFRSREAVEIDLAIVYEDEGHLSDKINLIAQILAQPGDRVFSYKGSSYRGYNECGFKVERSESYAKISIKLTVSDKFIADEFINPNFIE